MQRLCVFVNHCWSGFDVSTGSELWVGVCLTNRSKVLFQKMASIPPTTSGSGLEPHFHHGASVKNPRTLPAHLRWLDDRTAPEVTQLSSASIHAPLTPQCAVHSVTTHAAPALPRSRHFGRSWLLRAPLSSYHENLRKRPKTGRQTSWSEGMIAESPKAWSSGVLGRFSRTTIPSPQRSHRGRTTPPTTRLTLKLLAASEPLAALGTTPGSPG